MLRRAAIINRLPRPVGRTLRESRKKLRAALLAGRQVECPVCRGQFRRFATVTGNREILCPKCFSLERHRRIVLFLRRSTNLYRDSLRVLHIAPEPGLRRELRSLDNLDYVTADLHDPTVNVRMDVTDIDFPEESFDVILCSHVLEHVSDDQRAMREFRRILRRDGWALINVPSDPNRTEIYEDESIVQPAERLEHFGQQDHVRVYSTAGFVRRLRDAGFEVEVDPFCFSAQDRQRYVLDDDGWDHT